MGGSFLYVEPPTPRMRPSGSRLLSAQKRDPSFHGASSFPPRLSGMAKNSLSGLPAGGGLAPPSTGVGFVQLDFRGTLVLRSSRRDWSLTAVVPYSPPLRALLFSVLSSAFQYAMRPGIGVTLTEPPAGLQSHHGRQKTPVGSRPGRGSRRMHLKSVRLPSIVGSANGAEKAPVAASAVPGAASASAASTDAPAVVRPALISRSPSPFARRAWAAPTRSARPRTG